jgi:hypothetical protein
MLKKPASSVLASLRGSTLRGTPRIFEILKGLIRSPRFIARANGYTKCGPYLLATSLAAALLDSLFEHPEALLTSTARCMSPTLYVHRLSFSESDK